ncbi:Peptidyl-prolyl cis-trans isomerase [Komagataella phaffii CBS 7435]|uniref:peptidylprolyl isomerase n=1 Tax=Komagataella phaffii (strain ATCC 76273 / CBS 7435 / CECT 11047 / NRRL Y-11430 / Wegner 21-1) TaxID=981350 RepID=F2QUB4_KOMPC|nr:Peptidyl-prolyl cis-trans isomerase [Komagataella phaffii CBS 7435]CCA38992.1 Peptidyl-prolyl cis-trans isomerase [Komagataella phaffii CBS 7435]
MKVSTTKFLAVFLLVRLVCAVDSGQLRIGITRKVPPDECVQKTQSGDTVAIHYEGSLEDGTIFDSSYERDQPLEFVLGSGQVIRGWDQGLQNMCIGEQRKLTIPPDLGYGSRGIGPIPANAVLVFKAELVDIKKRDEL